MTNCHDQAAAINKSAKLGFSSSFPRLRLLELIFQENIPAPSESGGKSSNYLGCLRVAALFRAIEKQFTLKFAPVNIVKQSAGAARGNRGAWPAVRTMA